LSTPPREDALVGAPTPQRIVIVGTGLSGLRTAERLRRKGYDGSIVLVGGEQHLPYDRPPLSKKLLVQPLPPEEAVLLRRPERYDALDVELVTGSAATRLDLAERSVTVSGGRTWLWDRLVLATGVRPRAVAAWSEAGVHVLRTFDDCLELRGALDGARRLVVVGGGVLGCEVAAGARSLGMTVELVEPLATPMFQALGAEVGAYVAALHRRHGVNIRAGVGVASIQRTPTGTRRTTLTDGTEISSDVVLAAIGSIPNVEWLAGCGLNVGDGVLCDATGTTSFPDVLAVGDVAHMPRGSSPAARLEHWSNAADTANLVAGNVLLPHEERQVLAEVPYFWTDQYDVKLQTLGTPTSDDLTTVVEGSLRDPAFLALHSRDGRITGVTAVGHPAMLNRAKPLLTAPTSLTAALDGRPWRLSATP
jgi:NADPH-dependent 2,4-dienoyl-CoA reductase/sulfur reductase-like enzyme